MYFDQFVQGSLGVIGVSCVVGIIWLAMAGQWVTAWVAFIVFGCFAFIAQEGLVSLRHHYDTPERRLETTLASGCPVGDPTYTYSYSDGYCHLDRLQRDSAEEEIRAGKWPEKLLPGERRWFAWRDTGAEYTPLDGALENVNRLEFEAANAPTIPHPFWLLGIIGVIGMVMAREFKNRHQLPKYSLTSGEVSHTTVAQPTAQAAAQVAQPTAQETAQTWMKWERDEADREAGHPKKTSRYRRLGT